MHFKIFKYVCLAFMVSAIFNANSLAQESPDFAGDWTLKLGSHIFILLTLTPAPSSGNFNGFLIRPKHFTMSGVTFSSIKGPTIQEPVVRSTASGNCLSLTTQNPGDKSDETDYQLCLTDKARGTLKLSQLGLEPWPVTREEGPLFVATDWDNTRSYIPDDGYESNPGMQQIFSEDQRDRQQPSNNEINWSVVDKADAARRTVTRKLLNGGKLHTGEDFERAAFVFRHGDTPDDYLLAHTLAMVAVARGLSSAIWIAAATLDRYLDSIHQPQIYGTQFHTKPDEPATQEPYNRGLISDAVRRQLGVPSQAAQEKQRKQYDAERPHP